MMMVNYIQKLSIHIHTREGAIRRPEIVRNS